MESAASLHSKTDLVEVRNISGSFFVPLSDPKLERKNWND
jgi:hypothetical protein